MVVFFGNGTEIVRLIKFTKHISPVKVVELYITFPYAKPEHPEYVFRSSDEFPNEVLE